MTQAKQCLNDVATADSGCASFIQTQMQGIDANKAVFDPQCGKSASCT